MYNSIVVGTDGSDSATNALEHAVALAKSTGAKLLAVSAYKPVREDKQREARGEHLPGDMRHGVGPRDEVNRTLDHAKALAAEAGVECEGVPVEDEPASAVLATAEKAGADLIVVGNRGMKGARRILGSVPNDIAHAAECSVLIVQTV